MESGQDRSPAIIYKKHTRVYKFRRPIQRPILAIHEEEGNLFECGDTGSVTIGGGRIVFPHGKSREENVASVSRNYGASKSAAFGMKRSFDASDDKITHVFFPTKKQSYNKLFADDPQNESSSQYSDANPVSAVEDPVVPNHKIDLTLRMSLDSARTEPFPLKIRPIESGLSPFVASAMRVEPPQEAKHEEGIQDEHKMELEMERMMSRLHMQKENEILLAGMENLKLTNSLLSEGLTKLSEECMKQNSQVNSLMEEIAKAFGSDAISEFVTKDPNSTLQPVCDRKRANNNFK